MVAEKDLIGLSRDLIIHPGETLAEIIEDRAMSQRELAVRTGVTEKHISTVLHGQKGISSSFAKKLEYALGLEASFWMNLQNNYDQELLAFEELNNISDDEISVLKNLKEVSDKWISYGWIDSDGNPATLVIDYRMLLGVSNLLSIPDIPYNASYRAQIKNTKVDPYVLFAWQKMCELLTNENRVSNEIDLVKLRNRLPEIKRIMFMRPEQIQKKLAALFAECGIAFRVVPYFAGAPVQGFIKKTEEGALILCLTLRRKFADIFWFTLFHEIAHILNGDSDNVFIDFDLVSEDHEIEADRMACDYLINMNDYQVFVETKEYKRSGAIKRFAESQKVKDYIVKGRLMYDGLIPWGAMTTYDWG